MRRDSKYDLIIIGGGTAAFSAAIKANIYDVKTAMIERSVLGGTCVNVGCIPSKNILGAGEILHSAKYPAYSSISSCSFKTITSGVATLTQKGGMEQPLIPFDVVLEFERSGNMTSPQTT